MAFLAAKRAWDDASNQQFRADFLGVAYAYLQRVIGVIALALPIVVAVGDWVIDDHGVRGSISSYYYGRTGGWFVGSLCALGVFFLSYEYRPRHAGYRMDNILANFACLFAVGVALFPTSSEGSTASGGSLGVSLVHVASASALFTCLALFSLNSFTKSVDDRGRRFTRVFTNAGGVAPASRRWYRNLIHRVCGWTIVGSMAAIVINNAVHGHLMFWFESLAVWAFGTSWIVKSDWLPFLRDEATGAVASNPIRIDGDAPATPSGSDMLVGR